MNQETIARRLQIRGTVQGVGFRPFVHGIARQKGIRGWVSNGPIGVVIHAEGQEASLSSFVERLWAACPSAAEVTDIQSIPVEPQGFNDFRIENNLGVAGELTLRISPDLCVCRKCLNELNNPQDRRYRYPYVNCTQCGPRYSIIQRLPYDRPHTTMASWSLCAECQREYSDPDDRRYHAQPTACKKCGPTFRLVENDQVIAAGNDAIQNAAELLRAGRILGIKGIGGYHLACDASNTDCVAALRARKYRKEKPFAVMVKSLNAAYDLVDLTAAHAHQLTSTARPVVLADASVELVGVAPGSSKLGLMLPYAPLHHLLFECGAPSPLVMTSGNQSNEPIAFRDRDARARLDGIADALLVGERPIARRVDDSVVTVDNGDPLMLRRARGYAPSVVAEITTSRPILAMGSDLKNAIALVVDGQVIVGQHIGDLGYLENDRALEETVNDLLGMYEVDLADTVVAHDLHPEFVSTNFARRLGAYRTVGFQHHHAHIASVLAEHQLLNEPVLGVALDGTGYGTDGSIWGFEIFHGSVADGFERCLSLRSFRLPGGDAAVRFPVQSAAGFLHQLDDLPDMTKPPFHFPGRYLDAIRLIDRDFRCFTATSAGRLYDAVAALLGFTREVSFEGQAAVWLENKARQSDHQPAYDFDSFDFRLLMRQIVADRLAARDVEAIAFAFHAAISQEISRQVKRLSERYGVSKVAFSGGVIQNELLRQMLRNAIGQQGGLQLLMNKRVPPNDGGICLGQAAMASIV